MAELSTRRDFIAFSPPDVGDEEIAEVVDCLRSGWLTAGERVAALEERFAEYVGAEAALAVSSGTAAIHTGLLLSGIEPGDRVAVPVMTFVAAAHEVEHLGARPVFCDSEPDTLNIAVDELARVMHSTRNVRCVVPVHLHGHPSDLAAIIELARVRGVRVVDDAAHALPAESDGMRIGATRPGVLTAFSFYATKNMTTGEGGILTGSAEAIGEARRWTLHGITRDAANRRHSGNRWSYDVDRAGFKHNLSDIQAAIGLVQLRRLPQMHERRRVVATAYAEALRDVEAIQIPVEGNGVRHSWHIYAVRLRLEQLSIDRDRFISELSDRGVGTSVHFIPVHLMSYYADKYALRPEDFPVATREFERLVSLPIHSRMTDDDVHHVVSAVSDVAERFRR
jgi:dTDP-4-amino-4,6-dideoxygalactose transaminase